MKHTQGHKDRRRNYGGSKRGVSYVPKYNRPYDSHYTSTAFDSSLESKASVKSSETSIAKSYSLVKKYGKLTRSVLITLYAKATVPSSWLENVKNLKEVYSEESILPQAKLEFNLPMSKAIMPPRRANTHESREIRSRYYEGYNEEQDEDQGIVKAADNNHSNMNNAPLWFDSRVSLSKESDAIKADELFSMESLATRQVSLEEEKAKFNEKSTRTIEDIGTKVNPNNLFGNDGEEDGYSSIDVKYENSMKADKVGAEFFGDGSVESTEDVAAIDVGNLEAQMLKGMKLEEEGEEKPIWDAISAKEIKQQAQQDFSSWTFNLNPLNESPERSIERFFPQKQFVKEATNPFFHSSLNITETDKAWYYSDTQKMIQGPFDSIEMYNWYKAGYFPPSLPIRCGKYSPFAPLEDFLNSIKLRQQQELVRVPAHHFNSSNLQTFFDPVTSSEDPNPSVPTLSVTDLEASFKPMPKYNYGRQEQFKDPAIDLLDPKKTGYTKDEAQDLKVLLGFHNNTKG